MEAETLKKNISRILHERGWKLQDLERKAGTNRNIHNIFRNKSNNPSIDLLQKISKTLNVDYKELRKDEMRAYRLKKRMENAIDDEGDANNEGDDDEDDA